MRILVVHNFYANSAPSGENKVVEDEIKMLKFFGNEVDTFFRYNDNIRNSFFIGKIVASFSYIFNIFIIYNFKKKINQFNPDIVHIHNLFPLISPSIFYFSNYKIPYIITLHNYRLFCPNALPYRSGNICTLCIDKNSILPSLKYKCYRNNFFATLPIALNVFLYNNLLSTWKKKISCFLVFSEYQKSLLNKTGINNNKIIIKTNFINPQFDKISWSKRENYLLYVGRLTKEKGIISLIEAWKIWGANAPELRIIGDGALLELIKNKYSNLNIKLLGNLNELMVQTQISKAKLLIIPSECIEGCPLTLIEAFSYATPVAVSDLGPLPFFVNDGDNGVIFTHKNPSSIFHVISNLITDEKSLMKYSDNSYNSYKDKFTYNQNYLNLINTYKKALKQNE